MIGEDFVYFCQKSDQWNDVSKHLRESDVLSLGGAEGSLCLKTTNPEDQAVGIHYNDRTLWHFWRRLETNHRRSWRLRSIPGLLICQACR